MAGFLVLRLSRVDKCHRSVAVWSCCCALGRIFSSGCFASRVNTNCINAGLDVGGHLGNRADNSAELTRFNSQHFVSFACFPTPKTKSTAHLRVWNENRIREDGFREAHRTRVGGTSIRCEHSARASLAFESSNSFKAPVWKMCEREVCVKCLTRGQVC